MPSLRELMEARGIPPREITFAEPWQARAFALALALAKRGGFEWEDFRQRLIAAIARSDQAAASGQAATDYYSCWLEALEQTITAKAIANHLEIDARAEAIAANPPTPNRASSKGPIKIA